MRHSNKNLREILLKYWNSLSAKRYKIKYFLLFTYTKIMERHYGEAQIKPN